MMISERYLDEVVKKYKDKPITFEMIKKDLALSYILHEIGRHKEENKDSPFHKLIFKGGTLLAKSHLKYHRISEDLDFTFKHNMELNQLTKKLKGIKIKEFVKEELLPELTKICKKYNFDFDAEEINREGERKYCPTKYSEYLMVFNIYINTKEFNPIKIEISFCDEPFYDLSESNIFHLHSLSSHLIYPLEDCKIESYSVEEILLEKLRAIVTRKKIQERDIYDLYLLSKLGYKVFDITSENIFNKIKQGMGYRRYKEKEIDHVLIIEKRLDELERNFEGEIKNMNLIDYDSGEYKEFFNEMKKFILEIDFGKL